MEMLENPRWEDWNFKSLTNNRFSFLGNGTGTVCLTSISFVLRFYATEKTFGRCRLKLLTETKRGILK